MMDYEEQINAYAATRRAEIGAQVRELRCKKGWSQASLHRSWPAVGDAGTG